MVQWINPSKSRTSARWAYYARLYIALVPAGFFHSSEEIRSADCGVEEVGLCNVASAH
jgi:hypothetical protein